MKKLIRILAVCLVITLALTSCAPESGIRAGAWDGRIFGNDWSNIVVNAQGAYRALSPDEMREIAGSGEDTAVNDPYAKVAPAEVKTWYDFIVFSGDGISNIQLRYENLAFNPEAKDVDAAGYFGILKDELEAGGLRYTFSDPTQRVIGGEEYLMGRVLVEGGLMIQNYYIRKHDGAFIIITATSLPSIESEIARFITTFAPYKW